MKKLGFEQAVFCFEKAVIFFNMNEISVKIDGVRNGVVKAGIGVSERQNDNSPYFEEPAFLQMISLYVDKDQWTNNDKSYNNKLS